jgi:formylglycine-generating enzyme required for sulfatase activity
VTAAGRPLRVVHEKSGIPLLLVESGDARFYHGETQVTRAELQRIDGGAAPGATEADHPAIAVTFEEAQRACALAGLRLPTVEEWDLAARGPDERDYPWGAEWRDGIANVGSIAAVAAGSHPDDRAWCGALDMAGNVSEWCTSAGERALRGGSWSSDPESCKLSRTRSAPKGGSDYVGFRVVLDAP